MLPLFWLFWGEIWENTWRKRTYVFGSLTIVGFDNNDSSSTQESRPNEEYNDSSDDFSANKPSTSKEMAQNVVFYVHMVLKDVFEQGCMIDQKKKKNYPTNSKLA